MDVRIQAEKAERFRKLHGGPNILALPNAWTWPVRESLKKLVIQRLRRAVPELLSLLVSGRPARSRDQMLEVVGRIAHAVRVPVTADMEAGYGTTVKDMEETRKQ